VRFISLLSPFDRTQGTVEEKSVLSLENISSIQWHGFFQVR
jgi:hypothetical protein